MAGILPVVPQLTSSEALQQHLLQFAPLPLPTQTAAPIQVAPQHSEENVNIQIDTTQLPTKNNNPTTNTTPMPTTETTPNIAVDFGVLGDDELWNTSPQELEDLKQLPVDICGSAAHDGPASDDSPVKPIREFTCKRKADEGILYQAYHLQDAAKVLAQHSIDTCAQVNGRNEAKGGYITKAMNWSETEALIARKKSLLRVTKVFTIKKSRTSRKDQILAEVALTEQLLEESNQAPVMINDIGPLGQPKINVESEQDQQNNAPTRSSIESFIGAAPSPDTDNNGRILRHITRTATLTCTARHTKEGDRNPLRDHQIKIKVFDALLLERLLLSFRIDLADKTALMQYMRNTEQQRQRWYIGNDRNKVKQIIEHMKGSCLVRDVDAAGRPTLAKDDALVGHLDDISAGWDHIELMWISIRDSDTWDRFDIQHDLIRNAQIAVTALAAHARSLGVSIGFDVVNEVDNVLPVALSGWKFKSRPRIFAAVPCGYLARLLRFSNAPDVLVFGPCHPHASNCQVVNNTNLQRLPFSIKEKITTLLSKGLSNRQVFSEINKELSNASQQQTARQVSEQIPISVERVANLRIQLRGDRTFGVAEELAAREGGAKNSVEDEDDAHKFCQIDLTSATVGERFVRAYVPLSGVGFGVRPPELDILGDNQYMAVFMTKSMCELCLKHGDMLYVGSAPCSTTNLDTRLVAALVRVGTGRAATEMPVAYAVVSNQNKEAMQCFFQVMQDTIAEVCAEDVCELDGVQGDGAPTTSIPSYRPKVILTPLDTIDITGARSVFAKGHHEIKHVYSLLHSLEEVKRTLTGVLSTSRKPTTEAEIKSLDVDRMKIFTMFYSTITAEAKAVFENRFTALLAYMRENELDVLSAYFEQKWVGGGERPPSSWALCYRYEMPEFHEEGDQRKGIWAGHTTVDKIFALMKINMPMRNNSRMRMGDLFRLLRSSTSPSSAFYSSLVNSKKISIVDLSDTLDDNDNNDNFDENNNDSDDDNDDHIDLDLARFSDEFDDDIGDDGDAEKQRRRRDLASRLSNAMVQIDGALDTLVPVVADGDVQYFGKQMLAACKKAIKKRMISMTAASNGIVIGSGKRRRRGGNERAGKRHDAAA